MGQGAGCVCEELAGGRGRKAKEPPPFEHHSKPGSAPGTIPSATPFTLLGSREHDAHVTDKETEALKNKPQNEAGSGPEPSPDYGGLALLLIERKFLPCREHSGAAMGNEGDSEKLPQVLEGGNPVCNSIA